MTTVQATATELEETPTTPAPTRPLTFFDQPYVRTAQKVALGALGFLLFTRVLFYAPVGVLVLGALNGAIFSLAALGIVLIYRANRVINFAQGDIGAVGGVLGVLLITGKTHLPFFVGMAIGIIVAVAFGAITELLFVRRFAKSPRLILTVATLGIAQLFQAGELGLPQAFGKTFAPQIDHTPLDFFHFRFTPTDPILFGGNHLLVVLVVALCTVGLGAFFRFTMIGVAVRGSAESAERASQLGIPVKRIGTLVWMLAAGLAALSLFLQAPISGVTIGTALGPALLMRALAAAVIGKMENLGVTFAAAIAIGTMENAAKFATNRGTLGDAIVFAIIMAAFFLQKKGKVGRADDSGTSSWSLIKEVRPVPPELKKDPAVVGAKIGMLGLVAAVLVITPLFLSASKVNLVFEQGMMFAILGLSLVVLTGWAGEISIGQVAFFALGSTTAAKLASLGWNFFLCVLAAALVGAVTSLAIGLPALRVRGPFLAVATLGLALTTSSFFLDPHYFPWFVIETRVVIPRPILFGKFDTNSEWTFYYVLLIFLALVLFSVTSFRRSRAGRVLIASRDNARAAQAYGISVIRVRLFAFALSGFIAAGVGGLFTFQQNGLSRTFFSADKSILLFSLVVVGGLAAPVGALLGAAYYSTFSYLIDSPIAFLLINGLGLLIILLIFPGGLGGLGYDLRDSYLRFVANRRGIVVASLVADKRVEDETGPPPEEHGLADAALGFDEELEHEAEVVAAHAHEVDVAQPVGAVR